MKSVYLVYMELGIDGMDDSSLKVFEHYRDAWAYSLALKTHEHYPLYYSVEIIEKEII
jgi:hypothetical protein